MADEITTAGGQPEQPVTPTENAQTAQETPPAEKPQPLAEIIRAQRAEREAKTKATAEAADLRKALDEAKAELARAKAADDPLADPAAWVKARKMTPVEQAAFGEALLYDLAPDKAPADFRVKLLERRQARAERERTEREAAEREAAAAQAGQRALQDYEATLHIAARSFKPDSHPESQAWFGEDANTYAKSLLATARNLAEVAKSKGQVANLDPGHVADVLEQDIARRFKARDERRAGASKSAETPAASTAPVSDGGQTVSTKGLNSGGPRPPAYSDKERIRRAVAVMDKVRTV